MTAPRTLLFLPPGALSKMAPFRRWLVNLPVAPSVVTREGSDIIEFPQSLRFDFVRAEVTRLLKLVSPFVLVANLAEDGGGMPGVRYTQWTERGESVRGLVQRPLAPPETTYWSRTLEKAAGRYELFEPTADGAEVTA